MFFFKSNVVLVLGPHTDDGELGCGGTISKLLEMGSKIIYVVFSSCEESVPKNFPSDILKIELSKSADVLGIDSSNLILFDFKVRTFSYRRQDILDKLILIRSQFNPSLVFIPSFNDIHQDHKVIAEEGLRAFKNVSVFSYELIWNQISFNNQCFVSLEEKHVQSKIKSLLMYESQKHRSYTNPEFLKSLASIRGVQSGFKYAEMFEVHRLIF